MPSTGSVVIDDRLLIEELLVGLASRPPEVHTTTYWYYRACRAAVLGAGGHLSGPFHRLPADQQRAAVGSLLRLPDHITLSDPRRTVPLMVDLARRHPRLNLLNLEATAAARTLDATIWLSPEAAGGILPGVLDVERIPWSKVPYRES